ncbi:MAG: hypothetical protein U0470_09675 [Anaerolineae bacterium]
MPLMEIVTRPDMRSATRRAPTWMRCGSSCGGSASRAATWRTARCGRTSTSRCGRAARRTSGPRSRSRT